jgi:ectoine hydroxylase-related dioxygenase (phytanoyl-CoA dioxygenase family)
MAHEEAFLTPEAGIKPVPIEAAQGSLIIWSGYTWHATFPRTAPGIRLTAVFVFSRLHMRPIQLYRRVIPPPPGMLERNPPEFAELLGMRNPFPYDGDSPPSGDELNLMRKAGHFPWN